MPPSKGRNQNHPVEHSGAYKSILDLFRRFQQICFLRFRFRLHPWNLPEDKHNGKPLLKVSGQGKRMTSAIASIKYEVLICFFDKICFA
jgi:hypothetical protein